MPAKSDPTQLTAMLVGTAFEDFDVGQVFEHHWGRTLVDSDNLLFTTLTLHFNPTYFNVEEARRRGYEAMVINPLLVLGTVISLSVEDLSERSEAFLGIDDVVFPRPVYAGDTVTANSEVIEKRLSGSRPGFGVVAWRTIGTNQRDQIVCSFKRANLFATEEADSDGEIDTHA
jgi:itaconyl-CoA hydratase